MANSSRIIKIEIIVLKNELAKLIAISTSKLRKHSYKQAQMRKRLLQLLYELDTEE